jgi:hypothetical protein
MQNRYVGDIGDYLKFAILRKLAVGRSLGILWWLFPDENHNTDGAFREYLDRPRQWEGVDGALFGVLRNLKAQNVRAIELAGILPGAFFFSEQIPCDCTPYSIRPLERSRWFLAAKARMAGCDLLFVDPDNGIAPKGLRLTRRRAGKSIMLEELASLAGGDRCVVVYHHQTRLLGGHLREMSFLAERLRDAGIRISGMLRAKPWSPRLFIIVNADKELMGRAAQMTDLCGCDRVSWHSAEELL